MPVHSPARQRVVTGSIVFITWKRIVAKEFRVDRISELIGVLSDEAVIARSCHARRERTCKICGQPAIGVRTPVSELEYRFSSICQACQAYHFLRHD